MNILIDITLTGPDADALADVVCNARNEFPQNEHARLEDILGAALATLADELGRPALRLKLQRATAQRVQARLESTTQQEAA